MLAMLASPGNATGMMETPITHFIQWRQPGTMFAFCARHLYFISLYTVTSWELVLC